VLSGKDAERFLKEIKNPEVTEAQVKFLEEAIRVYNMHKP